MKLRNFAAASAGVILGVLGMPSAHATGDLWVEGSYEFFSIADTQFINSYFFNAGGDGVARDEFVNDDGDFDGFRIDAGLSNISLLGGRYQGEIKGFFAWHDDKGDLDCLNGGPPPGTACLAVPLFDPNPNLISAPGGIPTQTDRFSTERDIDHWGLAFSLARGPAGFKAGPAFRRIDQETSIIGGGIGIPAGGDSFQLAYSESLETDYWGGFVGFDGGIDLGGGWSLLADADAGLYWANTDYSGNYVVTGSALASANVSQSLSLESDEAAFIGVLKASLEKDFGLFRLAGFGRVEYISSAPDMAYNDLDRFGAAVPTQGPDDQTRIGERSAYSVSTGARMTVPLGSGN